MIIGKNEVRIRIIGWSKYGRSIDTLTYFDRLFLENKIEKYFDIGCLIHIHILDSQSLNRGLTNLGDEPKLGRPGEAREPEASGPAGRE